MHILDLSNCELPPLSVCWASPPWLRKAEARASGQCAVTQVDSGAPVAEAAPAPTSLCLFPFPSLPDLLPAVLAVLAAILFRLHFK